MGHREEIKSYIVREGMTMSEVVEKLADEYGWRSSIPTNTPKKKPCIDKSLTAARINTASVSAESFINILLFIVYTSFLPPK